MRRSKNSTIALSHYLMLEALRLAYILNFHLKNDACSKTNLEVLRISVNTMRNTFFDMNDQPIVGLGKLQECAVAGKALVDEYLTQKGRKDETGLEALRDWWPVLLALRLDEAPNANDVRSGMGSTSRPPLEVQEFLAKEFGHATHKRSGRPSTKVQVLKKFLNDMTIRAFFVHAHQEWQNPNTNKWALPDRNQAIAITKKLLATRNRHLEEDTIRDIIYDSSWSIVDWWPNLFDMIPQIIELQPEFQHRGSFVKNPNFSRKT